MTMLLLMPRLTLRLILLIRRLFLCAFFGIMSAPIQVKPSRRQYVNVRGDIIFLCDQDDVWYPNKIALFQERFIARPDARAVFTNGDVVDENLYPLGQLWKLFKFNLREQAQIQSGDVLSVFFKHPVVTGATMTFRSCYRDLVLPILDIWHDLWISLLIGATSSLDILPVPLIAYRQHCTNQFGIPFRCRNRGKTCKEIYEPQAQRYEMALKRLLQ